MNRAVFLDLNGTLVMPVQVNHPAEYVPIAGSIEAVKLLNSAGYVCPVITVQTRIEKGYFTQAAFEDWVHNLQTDFAAAGACLAGVYLCTHSFRAGCECHKPKPKLYIDAAVELEVDISRSYVVGDTYHDILAGQTIGAKTCFVRTGWAERHLPEHGHEADFIGDDLLSVAQWIVAQRR
jgi:D-glycero-D-manno-heptose 1,7-bisphosphate phosphatase